MDTLEATFEEAAAKQKISAVFLAAAHKDGSLDYYKSFGNCVERGLVGLDDDIVKYLPEWKTPVILKGIDVEGKPILENAKNKITLRQLLSHQSGITGLENEQINAYYKAYYKATGSPKGSIFERYFLAEDGPGKDKALEELRTLLGSLAVEYLLFEPGDSWAYGQGTDWAGQIVERLTDTTLERYCQKHIFQPLNMNHTTFRLLNHPKILENLLPLTSRRPDGTIIDVPTFYPVDPAVDLGGSNLYTSAPDFITFHTSLLRNDEKLLKQETMNEMFNWRLPDAGIFRTEQVKGFFEGMVEEGAELDHCLTGLVNVTPLKTGRKGGSVAWHGGTRCYWWIDRASGICGFYGSQITGMHEKGISAAMYATFEKAVYENYGEMK